MSNQPVEQQTPIYKHILWAVVAIGFVWAASKITSTLIVFSVAWLIAYLLNPAVAAMEGKRIGPIANCSRGTAVGLIAFLLVGFVVGAASLLVPQLTEQVQKLIHLQDTIEDPMALPMALQEKVEPLLAKVPAQYRDEVMERGTAFVQEFGGKIGGWVTSALKSIGNFFAEMLSGIFLICTSFLISMYMLTTWDGMFDEILAKLPRRYRDEVLSLSTTMNKIFGGYLKATILTSLACMVATFVCLLLLQLISGHDFPYKGIVSFVAGIAYPVPVIGIIATSILGGVLGYLPESNLGFGFAVLVAINVVNGIIDRTVQPKLMSDAIGVSELFVMFAAFAGGEVAGIWGMLLGIPVAAMGKALFEWFHLNFLLVDDPEGSPPPAGPIPDPVPEESPEADGTDPAPEPDPEPEPKPSKESEPEPKPKAKQKPKKKSKKSSEKSKKSSEGKKS